MDGAAMTAISVVMGVYNGAATLAETLDSILGQTERDFECIVVDDGSTDATPAILAGYSARDGRVRIISQANAGLTRALIAGCAAACGPYIARHDAGDLSDRHRLARQRALFEAEPRLAFVSCATAYVGPRGEPLFTSHPPGHATKPIAPLDPGAPHGIIEGPTHHGSVMFRRDVYERVGGYRLAFHYGQDWDLWYRLGAAGLFQSLPDVLYTARITPDSISASARAPQHALAELSLAAMQARNRGADESPFLAEASRITGGKRGSPAEGLYFIGEALRRNRDQRARGYLRDAIRTDPLHWRSWFRYAQAMAIR
jgi:glycosyltransferase involved in cell wall biosynthesis